MKRRFLPFLNKRGFQSHRLVVITIRPGGSAGEASGSQLEGRDLKSWLAGEGGLSSLGSIQMTPTVLGGQQRSDGDTRPHLPLARLTMYGAKEVQHAYDHHHKNMESPALTQGCNREMNTDALMLIWAENQFTFWLLHSSAHKGQQRTTVRNEHDLSKPEMITFTLFNAYYRKLIIIGINS